MHVVKIKSNQKQKKVRNIFEEEIEKNRDRRIVWFGEGVHKRKRWKFKGEGDPTCLV